MKYFVTGATGFIGGRLVRQLRGAGHDVRALVRSPSKAKDLASLGVALHAGDITDKNSMRAGMAGVDGVFHLAGWYKIGVRQHGEAERSNVQGTRHVLELMRELEIPKGVYTSTLAVFSDTHGWVGDESYRFDGPWLSEYDRSKWAAHHQVALPMVREGLPLVIVLPGVVYGPGDPSVIGNLLRQYVARTLPIRPHGAAFCWGHVDDTARGHVLAMEKGRPGECYILAGPPHTLEEVLEIAERITGIRPPRLRPPAFLLRAMAAVASAVEKVIPLPQTYSSETLRIAAGVTYLASSEKAQRELGFAPRPLEEGLRETLEHEMAILGKRERGMGNGEAIPTVAPAVPADLPEILSLLAASKLPAAGIADHVATTLVARQGGKIVGCAAVEIYGTAGLLRSVAVATARRGTGLGQRLTAAALELAAQRGVRAVYLLTTTAGDYFPRFGFKPIDRKTMDPALERSEELRGACPASALAMRADLRT
ncbi:MAG TPA: arsenic resistance N-acetyltransferase ArsN2 [Gemmatimonadales bacterium]|jgi:nucleoside-diphosphate-sugar epimerase/N-acetylglutamate synthase-like GNAT family acetyltransferase|nr:arsenic resistance N-acetyltransferase ArsN2 [Gemmatimonadales bacterium]